MTDRIVAWFSAGMLAVGVSMAALAGAAVAAAEEGADASTATTTTTETSSESTETPPKKERSGTTRSSPNHGPAEEPSVGSVSDDETEPPAATEIAGDDGASGDFDGEDEEGDEVEEVAEESDAAAELTVAATDTPEEEPEQGRAVDEDIGPMESAGLVETVTTPETQSSSTATSTALRHAATTTDYDKPTPLPSLLNVVGSFFWGVFDLFTKLVDIPPAVPPGSTLTAGRSTLEIDCGDGYTADADWYFPSEGEPEKFIYFQHGFPARAGFYNLTLQRLAERNNAIVVAPSITSNIFACDACASGGEPMHVAVARLFEGDRVALSASARAAGFEGTLPGEFVFAGQSAGASLAVGAAGFYYQRAPETETSHLVGVLLYDVSPLGGALKRNALSNGLDRLPATVPVLNIAAEPNVQNSQGGANAIFTEFRPGQFNGLQIVGGAHSDAFQSNVLLGIPQFIVSVLFGFSTPTNIEAVQVVTTGWLTDMYALRVYDPETRTGIYGEPGAPSQVIVDIPTTKGVARGYVLPALTPAPSFFDGITNWFFGLLNVNYYARCADFPGDSARGASAAVPQSCPL